MIAFVLGYWRALLVARHGERRILIRQISDEYRSAIQKAGNTTHQFRLGVLQRAGVARLSDSELSEVLETVTLGYGCLHPTNGDDILEQLPLMILIRAANSQNIDLGSFDDFGDFICRITSPPPEFLDDDESGGNAEISPSNNIHIADLDALNQEPLNPLSNETEASTPNT